MSKPLTTNNDSNKSRYPCWGSTECTSSWTYDNWHCTGCHWKGLGRSDIDFGGELARIQAAAVREKIFFKQIKVTDGQ